MPQSKPITLSIVIVNWNSGRLLADCLNSIGHSVTSIAPDFELSEVVVVDNASTDKSGQIAHLHKLNLALIQNEENRGFAAACNQGAARSSSDFILFLNPDTQLFENSLVVPLRYLSAAANSEVAVAGIQLVDDQGQVARSCSRFPSCWTLLAHACGITRMLPATGAPMMEWNHANTRVVDQVIGAFFMVRGKTFKDLQGFDERFFVYYEEVDFSLRAKQRSQTSVYVASASAYHLGGGTSNQIKARRLCYSLRSRLEFSRKHFTACQHVIVVLATFVVEPASRAVRLCLSGRIRELSDLLAAYVQLAGFGLRAARNP